jgi:hypothetical protein
VLRDWRRQRSGRDGNLMKLGGFRRLAAGAAVVLGVGGLAACLPGGGDPPPPPWCHPTGIALLESSLVDAARLGLDTVVDGILWKLDQCGGGGGGDTGGDTTGGTSEPPGPACEAFQNIVDNLTEQLQNNPGNPGLTNALAKAQARLDECQSDN